LHIDTQVVVFSCVVLQQRTAAKLAAAAHDGGLACRTVEHPASSHAARGVMSARLNKLSSIAQQ
tara:strand:- start:133 stop:324 length:192 start_codon:yes stop_codon:yes gene_type:complete